MLVSRASQKQADQGGPSGPRYRSSELPAVEWQTERASAKFVACTISEYLVSLAQLQTVQLHSIAREKAA